ncbi:MAG: alpha/beta fold hydrolase [bacterium]
MTFIRHTLAASAGVVGLATALQAQAPEQAVFLVRLGRDTLSVEKASFSPGHAESSQLLRTPLMRVERSFTLAADGTLQSVTLTQRVGARADSVVALVDLTVTGDSGVLRMRTAPSAGGQTSRIAVPRGAVHFVNLSSVSIEFVLRRARASQRDTVVVPLLVPTGQTIDARVVKIGTDSAVFTAGGVDVRLRTDAIGRMLGGVVPTQNVVFERLPGDSPVGGWLPGGANAAPVNYDAPAGAPYTAEQVTIRTRAGLALAGTFTMPKHAAGSRVPAVVLITGSGPEDRDEASAFLNASYRPFREIADTLSRRGVAVLRLDDRGVGGSDAGSPQATSADFADDIRAGLDWLRHRADVAPERLGLIGHSEGGMIAPMIASTDPMVHALVIIGAPAQSGRDISAFQRHYAIDHDPSIAPAARDSAFAVSERAVETAFASPGWLQFWANYDPLPAARRVTVPTLILQGETDTQVTPDQAATLAKAMRDGGNGKVTVRTFPRMNHLMLEDASGDSRGYASLPSYRVRRDFLGVVAEWIARTFASN